MRNAAAVAEAAAEHHDIGIGAIDLACPVALLLGLAGGDRLVDRRGDARPVFRVDALDIILER